MLIWVKKSGDNLNNVPIFLVNFCWFFSPLSSSRTCCSGRVKSILTAASCWELSERWGAFCRAVTWSWRKTSGGRKEKLQDKGQGIMRNITASSITWDGTLCLCLTVSEIKNVCLLCVCVCVWTAAALMRWQADPLQTVAGGTSRPETVSRSPALQLRGECVALCWIHTAADRVAPLRHLHAAVLEAGAHDFTFQTSFISEKQHAERFLSRLYCCTAF